MREIGLFVDGLMRRLVLGVPAVGLILAALGAGVRRLRAGAPSVFLLLDGFASAFGGSAFVRLKKKSSSSEELSHGTCCSLVRFTTSLLTSCIIDTTVTFGVAMCLTSASVNGLSGPSPSSATLSGWVEKEMSVPAPVVMVARPWPTAFARSPSALASFSLKGLLRQASRITMLVMRSRGEALERDIERHELERKIGLVRHVGIDRHHIVSPVNLQAMPGIEEHRGLSPVERAREVAHAGFETRLVEIEQQRHLEAEIAKLLRHGLGVVARIVELRHRDVSRIADDERDPPAGRFRVRKRSEENEHQQRSEEREQHEDQWGRDV